jgi:hypothetical protein
VALKYREKAIMETLKKNLRNPNITQVHLLYTKNAEKLIKAAINGCERRKLAMFLVMNKTDIAYRDIFLYINHANLQGHLVMVAHNDVYLGDGFEHIKGKRLGNGEIAYALTRRETNLRHCVVKDLCGEFNQYTGSHEAFIFNITTPVPKEVTQEMAFSPELLYAENALIWILKMKMKMVVRNPCKVIHVHKTTCVEKTGPKVRYRGHGVAAFSRL